jgi:hypothetical protein
MAPERGGADVGPYEIDPVRTDVALSSWQDEIEAALPSSDEGIPTQAQPPTIDQLAIRRNEDSGDEDELTDGVLALWPDSEWWQLV